MTVHNKKKLKAGLKYGWRSGFEEKIAKELDDKEVDFHYEKFCIMYSKPKTRHKYHPDFYLFGNNKGKSFGETEYFNGSEFFVETKGRFMASDRKKHILIKEQHPDLDLRFVFCNSKNKIYKGSKTTYADWCRQHGFLFADKTIPDEWLEELK